MLSSIRPIFKFTARFGRAREGATAVEFALLALPFFLLTFGLAEVTMVGFAQASLDYAVSETAREIRTGETQTGGDDYAAVKTQLCTEVTRLIPMNCATNLYLDVNRFTSFVSAQNTDPVQNGVFNSSGFGYNPGSPSDIVVVRSYYRWHVITPMLQTLLANVSGGDRIISSTMMFRNEPYPSGGP